MWIWGAVPGGGTGQDAAHEASASGDKRSAIGFQGTRGVFLLSILRAVSY